ncbi:hypothetical protein SAMN06265374_4141 [Roseibium denhamense]|uniref:Uncharacterized protein n=1 Tax=Roseibium denhamense TaxID=76305 RepID=A0ABY1PP12_9HYPH|nr:hypothetical protein SAMN06265374_4141 [Roseibium denhamense]
MTPEKRRTLLLLGLLNGASLLGLMAAKPTSHLISKR